MSIPTYLECIRPILESISDGEKYTNKQAIEYVTEYYKLTKEEQAKLTPSGGRSLIDDRVLWALLYLRKGDFVKYLERGIFMITPIGMALLSKMREGNLTSISLKSLRQESKELDTWYKSKAMQNTSDHNLRSELQKKSILSNITSESDEQDKETPSDRLFKAYEELKEKTIDDLVDKISLLDDKSFEIFIANLLPKLGYGKDRNDIIREHGGSGDGGIDAIVQLDSLGTQRIYIQAKHWTSPVGMKPVADFVDRVKETEVSAGLFVALSGFRKEVKSYISKHSHKIAWIDAKQLAEVMLRKGVGVIEDDIYRTYRVDDEYFQPDSI